MYIAFNKCMTHKAYLAGLDFVTTWKHTERWQEITKQIFETFFCGLTCKVSITECHQNIHISMKVNLVQAKKFK